MPTLNVVVVLKQWRAPHSRQANYSLALLDCTVKDIHWTLIVSNSICQALCVHFGCCLVNSSFKNLFPHVSVGITDPRVSDKCLPAWLCSPAPKESMALDRVPPTLIETLMGHRTNVQFVRLMGGWTNGKLPFPRPPGCIWVQAVLVSPVVSLLNWNSRLEMLIIHL